MIFEIYIYYVVYLLSEFSISLLLLLKLFILLFYAITIGVIFVFNKFYYLLWLLSYDATKLFTFYSSLLTLSTFSYSFDYFIFLF